LVQNALIIKYIDPYSTTTYNGITPKTHGLI